MAESFSCQAVVIRTADYGEANRMLTLLSPQYGKLSAGVRGCRKPGARLISAAQLFQSGVYHFAKNGDRLTLTQFLPGESHYKLRFDYSAVTCATYAANLCEEAALPEQPEDDLYGLLMDTLAAFCANRQPALHTLIHFELLLMQHLGYTPQLTACAACLHPVTAPAVWDAEQGGLLCEDCRQAFAPTLRRVVLGPEDTAALQTLSAAAMAPATLPADSLPPADRAAITPGVMQAVHAFCSLHLDKRHASLALLRQLPGAQALFEGSGAPEPPPAPGFARPTRPETRPPSLPPQEDMFM